MEPFEVIHAKWSTKVSKSIRFSTKSWWHFTTLQNTTKPLATQRFGASEKVEQNTLQNLSFIDTFGALCGKTPKKYPRSIRFSTKTRIGFRLIVKPYKTNGIQWFYDPIFRSRSTPRWLVHSQDDFWRKLPCRQALKQPLLFLHR